MSENMTPDEMKETILGYMIMKTDGVVEVLLTQMLADQQFIMLASSIGLDTERELLKILRDRIDFKLNQGETNV